MNPAMTAGEVLHFLAEFARRILYIATLPLLLDDFLVLLQRRESLLTRSDNRIIFFLSHHGIRAVNISEDIQNLVVLKNLLFRDGQDGIGSSQ